MRVIDLLWWFFDLDRHSSEIKQTPPSVPKEPDLDVFDPDEPDWFDDGDPDDEFFE